MKRMTPFLLAAALSLALAQPASAAPTVVSAFSATTTDGNQLLRDFSLGLDFVVGHHDTTVHSLGVFDADLDGLASDHGVHIYDRTTGLAVGSVFVGAGTGTLIDGYRYVDLGAPIILSAGFEGSIVVDYGAGNLDANANTHGDAMATTTPDFYATGILLAGSGRYGSPAGGLPAIVDTVNTSQFGPVADRYHSGSFRYTPNPEPGTFVLLGSILAGGVLYRRRRRLAAA